MENGYEFPDSEAYPPLKKLIEHYNREKSLKQFIMKIYNGGAMFNGINRNPNGVSDGIMKEIHKKNEWRNEGIAEERARILTRIKEEQAKGSNPTTIIERLKANLKFD